MGPPSYMQSVVDRNVFMRRTAVEAKNNLPVLLLTVRVVVV
jgi:hypothetical protein